MTVELETATGGTESIISEFVEPLQPSGVSAALA